MRRGLAAAAGLWPAALGAAVAARLAGIGPAWTAVVYAAAGMVCHQLPARSFWTLGVQWPVCARCAGLYLAAPVGALVALALRADWPRERVRILLALAGAPTALSWAAEHLAGWPQTNAVRAALAVPLGAAIAFVLVAALPLTSRPARRPSAPA